LVPAKYLNYNEPFVILNSFPLCGILRNKISHGFKLEIHILI